MTNKAIIEFGFRRNRYNVIYRDLHNSSFPTQAHSIIAKFKPSRDNRPRPQRNFTLLGVLHSCYFPVYC